MPATPKIVTAPEFAAAVRGGYADGMTVARLPGGFHEQTVRGEGERVLSYVLSRAGVGLDGFTVAQDGWILDRFLAKPVFRWGHGPAAVPIGRVIRLGVPDGVLRADVEYLDADVNRFADIVYRMAIGGHLNAVATRFLPRAWEYPKGEGREGKLHFARQELVEIGQVCVPGLELALELAQAAGIECDLVIDWANALPDDWDEPLMPLTHLRALYGPPQGHRYSPTQHAASESSAYR